MGYAGLDALKLVIDRDRRDSHLLLGRLVGVGKPRVNDAAAEAVARWAAAPGTLLLPVSAGTISCGHRPAAGGRDRTTLEEHETIFMDSGRGRAEDPVGGGT
jgi:hypothetical protein